MSSSDSNHSVKARAKVALNDEFLRNAVKYTTEKLRIGKTAATEDQGNWEQWRDRGREIRLHTIAHLDYYLTQFTENARAQGTHVHFASDAKEAVEIAIKIAEAKGAKSAVKSKSMVSEEIHMNLALEERGIEAVESDLGEYIIQLAGESPSHIIIPAIHKNKQQVAELFSQEAGEELPADTVALAGFARAKLREKFLQADIGMSGCNFAIAETGSMVLFSNEGNARMVTTVPKTQITFMGMERIIPSLDDLEVMATLLPRSATGQKLTVYMSIITGPRRQMDSDGPEEMHIIILDNGRSLQLGDPEFQELLNCIRCGACLNVCPVYRHIGGHSYSKVYSGPIGAVLNPALQKNVAEWDDIADASSLCGACWEACPVKIPLHDMLVSLRRKKVEAGHAPKGEQVAFKGFKYVMSDHKRYRFSLKIGSIGQIPLLKKGMIQSKLGPLKGWTAHRYAPKLADLSFRDSWKSLDKDIQKELQDLDPQIEKRLKKLLSERDQGGKRHGQ
jgi:L-lactate dehydrogenase complex protein LldF